MSVIYSPSRTSAPVMPFSSMASAQPNTYSTDNSRTTPKALPPLIPNQVASMGAYASAGNLTPSTSKVGASAAFSDPVSETANAEPVARTVETNTGLPPQPFNISGSNYAQIGGSIGGMVGSAIPGVGTIAGGIGGFAIGTLADFIIASKEKRDAQKELKRQMAEEEMRQAGQAQREEIARLNGQGTAILNDAETRANNKYIKARQRAADTYAAMKNRDTSVASAMSRINRQGR